MNKNIFRQGCIFLLIDITCLFMREKSAVLYKLAVALLLLWLGLPEGMWGNSMGGGGVGQAWEIRTYSNCGDIGTIRH